jgi:hypothetical protein
MAAEPRAARISISRSIDSFAYPLRYRRSYALDQHDVMGERVFIDGPEKLGFADVRHREEGDGNVVLITPKAETSRPQREARALHDLHVRPPATASWVAVNFRGKRLTQGKRRANADRG